MSLKPVLSLIAIIIIAIGAYIHLNTDENEFVAQADTSIQENTTDTHEQAQEVVLEESTEELVSPRQSIKTESPTTASFFQASKRCEEEVRALFKEYRLNAAFFQTLSKLAKNKFPNESEEMALYFRSAMTRLFYLPEPMFVSDANNLRSSDFKRPQMSIEKIIREEGVLVSSDAFTQAIIENNYALAESLLTKIVEDSPNSILLDSFGNSLLNYTMSTKWAMNSSSQSAESTKSIIDLFLNSGYQIHFTELVEMTHYMRNRPELVSYLSQHFNGNFNTVFDYKNNKSTNLVLLALSNYQYELAAFWLSKGVDPFSNYKEVSKLQRSHGGLLLVDDRASDKTIKTLVNAGLFTTSANKNFEERLNTRFPNANNESFYKQHQRVSTLSTAEDKRLQRELAEVVHELVAIHTKGNASLSKTCEDEFIVFQKKRQKSFKDRKQDQIQKEKYEQLHAQALQIFKEYNEKLIDADLAIEQLSLIDEYRAKGLINTIQNAERRSDPSFRRTLEISQAIDKAPDALLLKQLEEALLSNDYKTALELSESLSPRVRSTIESGIFHRAMANKASVDELRLLLSKIDVPVGSVLSSTLGSNDMQSLENIVNAGFDIHAQDNFGRTLLSVAIKEKHEIGFRALLRLGVDVEKPELGRDALDNALIDIIKGYEDFYFVQKLLGANKRIEDSHRQLLIDLLIMYPEPTQRLITKYGIVM
ncbi:hypothetical protein ISG33_01780 [Glaciecola sp. MH2013]|uniref:hypothetical protein n=1 Tax=Glaciecola sp. MH2013 TaxID=2785524 RepID=UPI00189F2A58|nr:hypothetical protein [Glaciecola sp. MH2013]MBF7072130.1 hypothetical protein [Glaciecola sp. MH2013]